MAEYQPTDWPTDQPTDRCWSTEKLRHVFKTDGDKIFKDLLTKKIFCKQILSWSSMIELLLNRGLLWGFVGWKLTILIAFFVKLQSVE